MRSPSQKRLLIIAASGALFVLLGTLGRLAPFSALTGVLTSPITHSLHSVGSSIANEFGVVGSARNLASDNAALRKQNADLRAALAQASAGAAELAAIKKELGIRQLAGKRLVPADVISTQPDSYRSYITINRGKADGLTSGMVVVVDGTLVGTISSLEQLSAKVLVVTDPTFKVAGEILTSTAGATGTVRGSIGGGLVIDKIPQDQKIHVGDTVITSGLGGGIVKGYSLGTIQSIKRADNGVFQSAQINTPIQIGRLQTVFVVAN